MLVARCGRGPHIRTQKAFVSEMLVGGFKPWSALDQGDLGSEANDLYYGDG